MSPEASDGFVVDGILVASDPGRVRILLDQVVLDLDENDVLNVSVLPSPPLLVERVAQAVRLELRRPTKLLQIGDAAAYEDVVWRRGHLFSLKTRRNQPLDPISEEFLAEERAFFEGSGIRSRRSNGES